MNNLKSSYDLVNILIVNTDLFILKRGPLCVCKKIRAAGKISLGRNTIQAGKTVGYKITTSNHDRAGLSGNKNQVLDLYRRKESVISVHLKILTLKQKALNAYLYSL